MLAMLCTAGLPARAEPSSDPFAAQAALAPDIIDVGNDRLERMTLDVAIAEHGPFRFLIDTGAERTVLSDMLASRLGLEFVERGRMIGVAGALDVDIVYLPEIRFGRQRFEGLYAPLLESRHIGADGILGLDGLQGQRVLFDFARERIEVADSGKARDSGFEIIVSARRRSGQLILTEATIAGVRTAVVIDTGAQSNIGNRELQKRLSRRTTGEVTILHSVTGQTIAADVGLASDFRIDRLRFDRVGMVFADAPVFARLGLDGQPAMLLGMDALRRFDRVVIDFARKKVLFDLAS